MKEYYNRLLINNNKQTKQVHHRHKMLNRLHKIKLKVIKKKQLIKILIRLKVKKLNKKKMILKKQLLLKMIVL